MDIRILQLLEGAKEAKGLTVVIDVFRAFSVECFLHSLGAGHIHPVGSLEECFALQKRYPGSLLVGERGGVKVPGFDLGNSPSEICQKADLLKGRRVFHSTSAGVQGVVAAKGAEEIVTGSLANARAVTRYILSRRPETVSLVCMGLEAKEETAEDTLCARYIAALLEGREPCIHQEIASLRNTSGRKFFAHRSDGAFPEPDFFMCLVPDVFDFVLRVESHGGLLESIPIAT